MKLKSQYQRECAKVAERALLAVSRELEPGVDEATDMDTVEMLAHLRFLCDLNDWDYAELDRLAYSRYLDMKGLDSKQRL